MLIWSPEELADLAKDIYLSAELTNRYKLYKSAAVHCYEGLMKLIKSAQKVQFKYWADIHSGVDRPALTLPNMGVFPESYG